MSDLETTQSKLRSTPTAGVAGEHSAYYRRLLSAGYKGYIQGSIGGATLYGMLGLAVGAAVAIPAFFLLPAAAASAAWLLIPAVSGIGVLHGASTFSDIGKTAAIIAESADTNEKRRYLLDRYYETPSDEEAKAIKQLLENQLKPEKPEQMFHWKTVFVGAALGLALAAGFILLAHFAPGIVPFELEHVATLVGGKVAVTSQLATVLGIGTALGTLAGGLIGLDREYVRRWLDKSETLVNDPARSEKQLAAREREIQSLSKAVHREMKDMPARVTEADRTVKIAPEAIAPAPADTVQLSESQAAATSRPEPISPRTIAGLAETPEPKVSAAQLQSRVASLQEALARPVV